jgi:hypothetical protein
MPGAVPGSATHMPNLTDTEGNEIWRISCVREYANDYMRVIRNNGFLIQQFDYDIAAYNKNQ